MSATPESFFISLSDLLLLFPEHMQSLICLLSPQTSLYFVMAISISQYFLERLFFLSGKESGKDNTRFNPKPSFSGPQ